MEGPDILAVAEDRNPFGTLLEKAVFLLLEKRYSGDLGIRGTVVAPKQHLGTYVGMSSTARLGAVDWRHPRESSRLQEFNMVNEQVLRGNWNEIRGKLQERYGQLTNDDVREFQGNVDHLVGMIQQKTGESREAIVHYLDKVTESGASFVDRSGEAARQAAAQAQEAMRESYMRGEQMVQQHPTTSVAVAFGAGMVLGVVVGLLMGRSH